MEIKRCKGVVVLKVVAACDIKKNAAFVVVEV